VGATLDVLERGTLLRFTYEEMLRYHGPGSPGGVAHAFKLLQRALPLLDPAGPVERRELHIRTAFGGPGARDGLELVTRAVTDGRLMLDPTLARPERGLAMERFVFHIAYRERALTLIVREGIVDEELILLARTDPRSDAQERRLDVLKQEMADRVMARAGPDVYDVA
jgi:hypothetical protein